MVLLPGSGGLVARAGHPPGTELPETDLAAATWVWQHNQAVGRGSDTLPGGAWLLEPLATARGVVGVLALRAEAPAAALPFGQRQLLEALARQAAIAIERTQVDAVLQEKAKTEAVMEAIEDGLIVLNPAGAVVHVNEVACTILAVDRAAVLGRPFAQLGTAHPHYLRLRAAIRKLEAADAAFSGASECTALVAKNFAFHQRFRNCRAVDSHKRTAGARRQFVNRACHDLFARTRFAGDQYGRGTWR